MIFGLLVKIMILKIMSGRKKITQVRKRQTNSAPRIKEMNMIMYPIMFSAYACT